MSSGGTARANKFAHGTLGNPIPQLICDRAPGARAKASGSLGRLGKLVIALGFLAFAPTALGQGFGDADAAGAELLSGEGLWGAFEAAMFYLFAGAIVASAVGVCVARKIDRMAVCLFFTLASVAALYFLLAANFIAAIQLIVYVGGVLVLLIFGVMLTSKSPWVRFDARKGELVAAALVCGGLLTALIVVLVGAEWPSSEAQASVIPMEKIGERLLTYYLVPFEAAGVLLFIVMVGAAHLARQEKG